MPKKNTQKFNQMKKSILYWFSFLTLLLVMTSCKSSKPIVIEKTKTITETITERDTTFIIEADSSSIKALIECQKGKPVIKKITEKQPGKNLKAPKISINDNGELKVDCEQAVNELKAKLREKEKLIEEMVQVPIEVPADISGWQWFQIWCGRIFLLGLLILLIGFILKKLKP